MGEVEGMPRLSLGANCLSLCVSAIVRVVGRFADASAREAYFLSWSREFQMSLHLNDGGALSTLAQARDFVLDLSQLDQAYLRRANAGELLNQGADRGRETPIFDVRTKLSRALRADGLM